VARPAWSRRLVERTAFFGWYPERLGTLALRMPRFLRGAREYLRVQRERFPLRWSEAQPILTDYHAGAGTAHGRDFRPDLRAARRNHARRPQAHVDAESRIDGCRSGGLRERAVLVRSLRVHEGLIR